MATVFHDMSLWGAWVSIPFSVIVGWVYVMMELIGDYSENPFESMGNDIPMLALCRTIEIDLRESSTMKISQQQLFLKMVY